MKILKLKTALVIAGAIVLVTSGSLAYAAYTGGNESTANTQVVKTESAQVMREIQSGPEETASQTNVGFQGYTYEQQGDYLKDRKQERDRLQQESDNR